MALDQREVRRYAEELARLLAVYALTNRNAASLQRSLSPLLEQARTGRLTAPVDPLPSGRLFDETDLRALPALEAAFAAFGRAISGLTAEMEEIDAIIRSLPVDRKP